MFFFEGLGWPADAIDTYPHIYPLTNISLSELQRGKLDTGTTTQVNYIPPSLDLYTLFSPQTYFFAFWGILILQTMTIFIIDKTWVRNVPKSATLWDRILHSLQKSSFPFPYTNWHQENGSCNEHLKRKQAVQLEVLVAILINLLFNMILLLPLPIFCKIYSLMRASNTIEIKNCFFLQIMVY